MGLYDDIMGECPYCHAEYYAQTKLGACGMREWRVGSKTDLPDGRIVLKDECECGNQPVAIVKDGVITALEKRGPKRTGDILEGAWGSMVVCP